VSSANLPSVVERHVSLAGVCVGVDVDECREMTGVCANGDCINLLGSFNCICHIGHRLTADRTTCIGACV